MTLRGLDAEPIVRWTYIGLWVPVGLALAGVILFILYELARWVAVRIYRRLRGR